MNIRNLCTIDKTIKILKIVDHTFCQWVRNGRLIIVTQKDRKTGKLRVYVTKESIKNARQVTCKFCGKVFKSIHPLKAEYCSIKCRHKAIYARVKKIRLATRRKG